MEMFHSIGFIVKSVHHGKYARDWPMWHAALYLAPFHAMIPCKNRVFLNAQQVVSGIKKHSLAYPNCSVFQISILRIE